MTVAPHVLVAAHLFQRKVLDRQQAGLFQVGRGNTPAALQVAIQAIAKYVAKRPLRFGQRLVLHVGITGVQVKSQTQRIEDLLCQLLVMQPFCACLLYCPVQC